MSNYICVTKAGGNWVNSAMKIMKQTKTRFQSTHNGTRTTWDFYLEFPPSIGDVVKLDGMSYNVVRREFYPQHSEVYITLERI